MGTQEKVRSIAAGINPKNSALSAEPTAAPAGGSGATAGAYDGAANRDIMIDCVNETRTRVAEIETALIAAGLLPT